MSKFSLLCREQTDIHIYLERKKEKKNSLCEGSNNRASTVEATDVLSLSFSLSLSLVALPFST